MKHLCKTNDPKIKAQWDKICDDYEEEKERWIENLRNTGVIKAAHPNDGWVDRDNNIIQFVYPYFNDDAGVGSLVAIGGPTDRDIRLVRLTIMIDPVLGFAPKWGFEDIYGKFKSKKEWLKVHGAAAQTIGWFLYGAPYFDSTIPDDLYFK
jgi:hypothetical protein